MRPGVLGLGLAGVVALSLVAASCGGSSGGSGAKVAQVDSTQSTTTGTEVSGGSKREALVAFAACMRKQGVPKFPDPEAVDGGMRLSIGSESGIDPNAPQFKRAERACKRLLPHGGVTPPQEQARHLREALGYARCMRGHSVERFPDPKVAGDGGIGWDVPLGPAGINSNSPQFRAADQACRKLFPAAAPGERP
jgi:hypothetical protein